MKSKSTNPDNIERAQERAELDRAIDATLDGFTSALDAWKHILSHTKPQLWGAEVKGAQLRAIERRKPQTADETKRIQTSIRQTSSEAAVFLLDKDLGKAPQPQRRAIGRHVLEGMSLAQAMRTEREEREARAEKKRQAASRIPDAPPATTVNRDVRYAVELCDELASVIAELPEGDRVTVTVRLLNLVHGETPKAKAKAKKAA